MGEEALYVRLRTALGLGAVAVGSLGSGPCGVCLPRDEGTHCVALDDYSKWAAELGEGGAGGTSASGAAGQTGEAGASSGAGECPSVEDFARFYRVTRPGTTMSWSKEVSAADAGIAVTDGGTQCCYFGTSEEIYCPGGRPFLVDGEAELAELEEIGTADGADVVRCDALVARLITRGWLGAARVEHASVASFARLTLELLAFGAPVGLVEDAQRAALDELRHAELCLSQAHRYTARRYRFGRFAGAGRGTPNADFASFVARNILEGCIGETLAAAIVTEQARAAMDARLKTALRAVADDETRHAALAWRIVRWAFTVAGPELRAVAESVFEFADTRARHRSPTPSDPAPELSTHGLLDRGAQDAIAARVWADVLRPLSRDLLAEARQKTSESERGSKLTHFALDR
jgi:hypothetical protein